MNHSTNNYLRGEIEIVDGVGNTWNVLLNTNALRMSCESMGVELGEFLETFDKNAVSVIPHLMYNGVRNYQILNRIELIDDFDHFAALCGTMDFSEIVEKIGHALTLDSGNDQGTKKVPKK